MSTTSSIEHRTLAKLDAQITYHLDELRKSLGLAELTPEFLEFLLREVEPSPFIDGKEPMDFGSFSIALDGKPLSDHQLEVFGKSGLLTAFNLVSSRRVVRECVLGWGKGSIRACTLLKDELTNEIKTALEWEQSGRNINILSRFGNKDQIIKSSPVYKKYKESLWHYELEDGRYLDCTQAHKVLTRSGWQEVGELSIGSEIFTNSGYVPISKSAYIGEEFFYDLWVPDTECYYDANGVLHHNSGKDWISARFCAWAAYVFLHMVAPQQYLRPRVKTLSDDRIEIINVAPKGDLAKRVFFEELSRNFHRDIFKPFILNERTQFKTEEIIFPQINLHVISQNSSASGLDGYNPIIWIMDEADAFLDNGNKSNAEQLRRILSSSAQTRWPGRWLGFVLSYLRSGVGFMARHVNKFKLHPVPQIFVDQAASWTVNPNISKDDPEVKLAYWEDPVAAAAMYEGIVPPVTSPFFSRYEYIRQSVGTQKSPAVVTIHRDPGNLIQREMNGVTKSYVWPELEHIQREPGRTYYMGVDAGETGDSFAISVVSVADDSQLGPGLICPSCWQDGKSMYLESIDGYRAVSEDTDASTMRCGLCGYTPADMTFVGAPNYEKVRGWQIRGATSSRSQEISIAGEVVEMPHIREDILISIDPIRRRELPELPDGAAVDYLATQQLMERLCKGLNIKQAGFDPSQMVSAIQYLSANTETSIYKASFSNTEQFVRMRLTRFLLYSGLILWMGTNGAPPETVEKGCRELEQLQKDGQRLDHPPNGGSKDLADARGIAIFLAAQDTVGEGQLEWLFSEKPLKSASGNSG